MHTQQISMKNQYVDSSIESRARETNCLLAVEREMLSHDIVIEGRIIKFVRVRAS
jgi:hypothetical protein